MGQNDVNPLAWNIPIVNKDGTPTNEFMRKWEQQAEANASIPAFNTASQVSAVLDLLGMSQGDILFRSAAQWVVLSPGAAGKLLVTGGPTASPAWNAITGVLDTIGAAQGDTLYRGAAGWTVLPPGTNGQVLTYDTATSAPKWDTGGGGGGGVIIGAGAPTALEPAGTLYSRSDTAGVYVSTPATSGSPLVVQNANRFGSAGPALAPVFATALTTGNLLLASCGNGSTDVSSFINTAAGWNLLDTGGAANGFGYIAYRYVQAGDNTTPPSPQASGTGAFWAVQMLEISGMTGTWATDFDKLTSAYSISHATTVNTTGITNANAGALALVFAGEYDSGAAITGPDAPWTTDSNALNTGAYGGTAVGHQVFSAAGATVQASLHPQASGGNLTYYAVIILNNSGAQTAGWTLIGPGGGGGGVPTTSYWDTSHCGTLAAAIGPDYFTFTNTGSLSAWAMMWVTPTVVPAGQKLYVEFLYDCGGNYSVPGIVPTTAGLNDYPGDTAGWGMDSAGNPHGAGGGTNTGVSSAFGAFGDVFAYAVDFGAGTIQMYLNNVAKTLFSGITFSAASYALAMGANSSLQRIHLHTTSANQKYAPPTGFVPWG